MPIKILCVSNNEVYEIPTSKVQNGKIVNSELSGKTVLKMEMLYSTQNRKPYTILRIWFDRITFDQDGVYNVSIATLFATLSDEFKVTILDIGGFEQSPSPVSKAPILPPSRDELESIKTYLNKKYPSIINVRHLIA